MATRNRLSEFIYKYEGLHIIKDNQNLYKVIGNTDINSNKRLEVFFDDLCQPYNPGGSLLCIRNKKQRECPQTIHSEYGLAVEPFTDYATNNVTEYTGIIKALECLLEHQRRESDNHTTTDQSITIKGDSQLVIYQIKGRYKVKAIKIIPLYQKVMSLLSKFDNIRVEWIPGRKTVKQINYLIMHIQK